MDRCGPIESVAVNAHKLWMTFEKQKKALKSVVTTCKDRCGRIESVSDNAHKLWKAEEGLTKKMSEQRLWIDVGR